MIVCTVPSFLVGGFAQLFRVVDVVPSVSSVPMCQLTAVATEAPELVPDTCRIQLVGEGNLERIFSIVFEIEVQNKHLGGWAAGNATR